MTETVLSETTLRESLLEVQVPAGDGMAVLADLLLAAGVGGVAALICVGVLRLLSRRRAPAVRVTVQDRIAALQALPEEARRVGFLHLLRELAPERYAQLRGELYRRHTQIDAEEEVRRVV